MSYKLILDICKTLLLARFRQSLVAAIGVTFSITMFISLTAFMEGFNKFLDDLIINRTPHVLLYNEIKASEKQPIELSDEYNSYRNFIYSIKPQDARQEIRNSLAIIDALKREDLVLGVAPKITAQVFYQSGDIDINGIVYGIDVPDEERLFFFSDYVVAGDPQDLETVPNSIILGKGVAEKMLVDIGDNIQVSTARGGRLSLKVVGIFQLGVADIDAVQSYASLQTTQNILGENSSYITDIQVKLYDMRKAPELAERYHKMFDTDTKDIISSNAQFETGSSVRTIISYSVSITLLVVAGFGIYNILNMMIYEKMDSIAIMKATGFSGKDVKKIFLTLSLMIGVVGGLAGLIFGLIGTLLIDQIPFETTSLPTIKTFPVVYEAIYYIIGIVFSIGTTIVSGYFPAKKASKVDPVEIIRGK